MIDRTQALWARRYVLKNDFPGGNRQGVLLCTGATKGRLLFVGSRLVAKYFFDAINVRYAAEVLVRGVDEKGAINDRPEVLEQARDLGRRLAQVRCWAPLRWTPWRFSPERSAGNLIAHWFLNTLTITLSPIGVSGKNGTALRLCQHITPST